MDKNSDDPLAEFRGGETQIGGISRKVAGQVDKAAFRQISRSATADQVAGDPHHYDAYGPGDRSQERLEIRRILGEWDAPSYRYLMTVKYDGQFGTRIMVVYSFMLVKIEGRNLQEVGAAIREGICAFIQEYHPNEFTLPAANAPVITRIELVDRMEETQGAPEKEKTNEQDNNAASSRIRPGGLHAIEDLA